MTTLKYCLLAALLIFGTFSQEEIYYSTPENVNVTDYGTTPPPGVPAVAQPSFQLKSAQANSINDANAYMKSNSLSAQAQWVFPKDNSGQMRMATSGHWWNFSTSFNTDCPQGAATITVSGYPW